MGIAIGIAGLVVGVGSSAYASKEQSDARRDAAGEIEDSQIQNAQFLARQGRESEEAIRASTERAMLLAPGIVEAAAEPLAPFKEAGIGAFEDAEGRILDQDPRLISAISKAATSAITDRPGIFDLTVGVGAEVERQGEIIASGAEPFFMDKTLGMARTGVQAGGDIAGLQQRGANRAAELLAQSGAQRGSALIGRSSEIADLILGSQQASLLGDVAKGNARVDILNSLAELAGELS